MSESNSGERVNVNKKRLISAALIIGALFLVLGWLLGWLVSGLEIEHFDDEECVAIGDERTETIRRSFERDAMIMLDQQHGLSAMIDRIEVKLANCRDNSMRLEAMATKECPECVECPITRCPDKPAWLSDCYLTRHWRTSGAMDAYYSCEVDTHDS